MGRRIGRSIIKIISGMILCTMIGCQGVNSLQTDTQEFEKIKEELKVFSKNDQREYGKQEQIVGGVEALEQFAENSQKGIAGEVTIIHYTLEANPIFVKVVYDGEMYYGVQDNTQNPFGSPDYETFKFAYLQVFDEVSGKSYYLFNDADITSEKYFQSMLSSQMEDKIDSRYLYTEQPLTVHPQEAVWILDENTGLDAPDLDYASEESIIFHGFFGLFVYDLRQQQITQSLNLREIGCEVTQGSNYCEVTVSADGKLVQLNPSETPTMYVYDIEQHSLEEVPVAPMANAFEGIVPSERENSKISWGKVVFENGEEGYLYDKDHTLGGLCYKVGDREYKLFTKE
ncbi:MAG: DUF4362 domain-containing protein [Cellulosilyticaceae bacterium]